MSMEIERAEGLALAALSSVSQLSENIADLSNMIAPQYSATATYALNALCIHEGKLYKCTTAIETAEEWTAEHWTQTTLAALINA